MRGFLYAKERTTRKEYGAVAVGQTYVRVYAMFN